MRRTTSALFTAIVGAGLTASMVSAQQSRESDRAARSSSADSTSSTDSTQNTVYGITNTRGARYLLRNGLDYLNYQQYERALKFLREAETRPKELNDAEKRALKRGIERAQRGLREAADAEAPYAMSEKSRRRNGFTVAKSEAKPEVETADNSSPGPADRPIRQSRASMNTGNRSAKSGDGGEPIKLTSGTEAQTQVMTPSATDKSQSSQQPPLANRRADSAQPATLPDMPKFPDYAPMADGSARNESPAVNEGRGGYRGASVAGRVAPRMSESSPHISRSPNPGEPGVLPIELSQRPGMQKDQERASDPAPANPPSDVAPAVSGTALSAASLAQAEGPRNIPAGAEAEQAANASAGSNVGPKPAPIELETTPQANPADQLPKTDEANGLAQSQTEAPAPQSASAPIAESVPARAPASPPPANELPLLPAEVAGAAVASSAITNTASATARAAGAGDAPPSAPPTGANELPPLPAEPGQAGAANATSAAAPSLEVAAAPPPQVATTAPPEAAGAAQPEVASPPPQVATTAPPEAASSAPPEVAAPPQQAVSSGVAAAPAEDANSQPLAGGAAASEAETSSVDLPPLPEDVPAVQPGQVEAAPIQNAMDREPAASPAGNSGTVPDGATGLSTGSTSPARNSGLGALLPQRVTPPSTLRPELQREVDRIARMQEEDMQRRAANPPQPAPPPDSSSSDLRMQTQLDISRAPSPAEARPIKAIPVPEDWVPLGPREWTPQRKYWAAAATCHLPLYFQDAVLERYGHSVEQFVGPYGRFLTYPVDDPTQSTQRNQILQPFFSAGLFGLQIIAWPYNLIMDPPWEAQYDLGYYRPGDQIPTDTYWLPLHGYGPPLHGSNY